MKKLNDLTINEKLREINRKRMDYFIPNYLIKHIRKEDEICSVGCGTGYDVEVLNNFGYNAYGLDPGSRVNEWKHRNKKTQEKLRFGFVSDFPFQDKKFDFIYSLEVIEHVGCKDGVWQLLDNYNDIRINFIESCIQMLKKNGRLIITTPNKLFPFDPGHGHHYSKFTNYFTKKGFHITIPWHKRNFLVSYYDFLKWIRKLEKRNKYEITQISSFKYPSNSGKKYGKLFSALVNSFLYIMSLRPLIRLNPILVIKITMLE